MRRWIWIALILLSGGLTLWGIFRPQGEQGLSVRVVRAEGGAFVQEVRASGSVEARLYALTFPRPGRVAEVRVREGQVVRAGQVLAVLETADDREKLRASRESLAALQSRLSAQEADYRSNSGKLERQLAEARRNLELAERLLVLGSVALSEVEQLRRQVADLQAQLSSLAQSHRSNLADLQAQLAARRSEIAALERSLAQAELRTPVDGTVSSVGYLVGVDTGASAIRVVEAGSLRVQARLAEAEVGKVKPGQPVRIELDAAPGVALEGKVERLGVQAEVAGGGGSAVLPVFIRFLNPDAENWAKPGLTATARITTLRLAQAVKVPLEALVEEGGQSYVWRVEEASRSAKKQLVTVRARNLTQAAVEGLEAGALLVSLPPETLKDGQKLSYRLSELKE
ncbi:efflux RND transporter periplasmic adaptor subunit [Calidithermus timidus]|jgi:HlyD family secretion protein|uniref:efflux RND transporter periplasmic adaptor subunit n=1 Tax=Calidithermus timidus TaxID=307124 RepID=UPI000372E010|nr:HlyD family efflux transporter periplasmic adaptor subunit [Calidithermus timidus]